MNVLGRLYHRKTNLHLLQRPLAEWDDVERRTANLHFRCSGSDPCYHGACSECAYFVTHQFARGISSAIGEEKAHRVLIAHPHLAFSPNNWRPTIDREISAEHAIIFEGADFGWAAFAHELRFIERLDDYLSCRIMPFSVGVVVGAEQKKLELSLEAATVPTSAVRRPFTIAPWSGKFNPSDDTFVFEVHRYVQIAGALASEGCAEVAYEFGPDFVRRELRPSEQRTILREIAPSLKSRMNFLRASHDWSRSHRLRIRPLPATG